MTAVTILCTIYLEPGLESNNLIPWQTIGYQFYSRTSKCEFISETRKALIALIATV